MQKIRSLNKKCCFKVTEENDEIVADIAMENEAWEFLVSVVTEKLERTGAREKLHKVKGIFIASKKALVESAVDIIDLVLEVIVIQKEVIVLAKYNARMKGDTCWLCDVLNNNKIIFKCAGYQQSV